jgi:hypothetical protein
MSEFPRAERMVWRGLACTRLGLPNGDSAVVSDFGAQVLSWEAQGQERLFLSPRAVLDGSAPSAAVFRCVFPSSTSVAPCPSMAWCGGPPGTTWAPKCKRDLSLPAGAGTRSHRCTQIFRTACVPCCRYS